METSEIKPKQPVPPEGSCHYFVVRKKRFCRFKPAKDIHYCAEHAGLLDVVTDKKRMQCPYDSKHTCYVSKLNHHLKRCPSRPKEMPVYHCPGINAGDDAGETVPDPKVTVLTVGPEEVNAMVDTVNMLYEKHLKSIEEEILSHPCMQAELNNTTYGTAAMRHRKQQASLIGHMEKLGLLTDNVCYLEMGAGKGQLSHWLHGAVEKHNNVGFLLVDRSHVRNKFDNLHKEEENGPVMERIRIDIEHLNLGNIPRLKTGNQSVVAYGKHLCGSATDLALRCMIETLQDQSGADLEESSNKRPKTCSRALKGTVIALCCHHRCTWKTFVGKKFFQSCGLTARDFQLMSGMSSWAVCAWKGWSHSRKTAQQLGQEHAKGSSDSSVEDKDVGTKATDVMSGIYENDSGRLKTEPESDKSRVIVPADDIVPVLKAAEKQSSSIAEDVPEEEISDDELEHQQDDLSVDTSSELVNKLSEVQREEVGRKCKRLIDYGRVMYLKDHGLTSCLKSYIKEYFTPENVLLLGSS